MVQRGTLASCTRCGKRQFFPDPQLVSIETTGWSTSLGITFCPKCAEEYETRKEKFIDDFMSNRQEDSE